jgi:hypothetical protein
MFQSDLLECHKVVCKFAFTFADSGIGTLTQLVQLDGGLQFPKANLCSGVPLVLPMPRPLGVSLTAAV